MDIHLRALSIDDGDDVHEFLQELGPGENGFGNMAFGVSRREEFPAYLQRNVDMAEGKNLGEGFVPQTTFWLVVDGEIVGLGKLRHGLNKRLKTDGGHIGYSIKQAARGKGYGTEILRLLLIEARKLGLDEVLLTIRETNEPSKRTATRNGREVMEIVGNTECWWIRLKE